MDKVRTRENTDSAQRKEVWHRLKQHDTISRRRKGREEAPGGKKKNQTLARTKGGREHSARRKKKGF